MISIWSGLVPELFSPTLCIILYQINLVFPGDIVHLCLSGTRRIPDEYVNSRSILILILSLAKKLNTCILLPFNLSNTFQKCTYWPVGLDGRSTFVLFDLFPTLERFIIVICICKVLCKLLCIYVSGYERFFTLLVSGTFLHFHNPSVLDEHLNVETVGGKLAGKQAPCRF